MKAITDIIRAFGKGPGFVAIGFLAVYKIGSVVEALLQAPPEMAETVGKTAVALFTIVCSFVFGTGLYKRIVDKRTNGNGVTTLPPGFGTMTATEVEAALHAGWKKPHITYTGEATHATRESVGG